MILTKNDIDEMLVYSLELLQTTKLPKKEKRILQLLDESLENLHLEYKDKKLDEENALNGICLSLGILIGTLITKKTKGIYTIIYGPSSFDGQETLMLNNGQHELYVADWVYKNIVFGEQENAVLKYKSFIKDFENGSC